MKKSKSIYYQELSSIFDIILIMLIYMLNMLRLNKLCSLLGSHLTKGSPVKPVGQLQIGL